MTLSTYFSHLQPQVPNYEDSEDNNVSYFTFIHYLQLSSVCFCLMLDLGWGNRGPSGGFLLN